MADAIISTKRAPTAMQIARQPEANYDGQVLW